MIDTEKLDSTFRDALALPDTVDPSQTSFANTPEWDSVGHLQLLAGIEEAFAITLATQDAGEMVDYQSVRRVLEQRLGDAA